MIAKAPYLFLLLILIPDLYFDLHYWRHKYSVSQRLLRWLPSIIMVALTIKLAYEKSFIPDNPAILWIFLLLIGLIAVPKAVFMLCSIVGLGFCKLFRSRRNFGNLVGLLCVPVIWYILLYGSFIGFNKLEVNRQTFVSKDLPQAFDGYKVVILSDAHVGSYNERNAYVLKRAIDSINAQRPDIIVFLGDLQNTEPKDIYPHMDVLSSLKAKDGIYTVLGNHDYGDYICGNTAKKVANCRETMSLERQMGWTLLLNEHRYIDRKKSSIIIAGMENDGDGIKFPQKGDVKKTLKGIKGVSTPKGTSKDISTPKGTSTPTGVSKDISTPTGVSSSPPKLGGARGGLNNRSDNRPFILMLEHDPSSWRRKIIPDGRAQLTLSGHTHRMQFALFGWCPMALLGNEFYDWYHEGDQSLFVTAGLGGLIPFRFGATGEIVVLTLRRGN